MRFVLFTLIGSCEKKYQEFVGGALFCFFILIFVIPFAHAEPIAITISDGMENVIFDGKWTFAKEWKQSSLETIHNESNAALIHIRTAHLNNFIYVMLNVVSDKTIDFNQDEATVCFDSNYDQNSKTESNAYCFVIELGSDKPVTMQSTDNSEELVLDLETFKSPEEKKKKLAKRISGLTDNIENLSNQIYHLQQRIELLEKKLNINIS